jgi:predicted metal-dependent hydrolase
MSQRTGPGLPDLQLGLFDTVGESCAAPPERPPQAPAPSASPAAAPPPAPAALAPAVFAHPHGTHQVRLGGHVVGYAFRRARRRSIGFTISTEGLSVSAPRWVSLGDVDAALQAKAGWVLRKLQEQQERARRQLAARVDWRDGTSIPFLGDTVIVVLDPRATGAVLNADGVALPGVPRLTLHVGLPQHATPEQIRDAVQSWLQRQARRVFEERCSHFAAQLGVRMKRLSLSSASTRWGSASADGSIRLNWRLIHFGLATIDYVVTHELAHLREMNHSAAFWSVVKSVMPDYETVRETLKRDVLPVFD